MRPARTLLPLGALLAVLALRAGPASAQLAARPEDPTGLSLRFDRAALRQLAEKQAAAGAQADPFLSYALGHAYFQREWSLTEGLLEAPVHRRLAGRANSCGMCHNLPFRAAGSGGNVIETGGFGRNVPHLFGAGLVESIGFEIRRQLMAARDANGNGFLDVPAETRGARARVEASPGVVLDYGSFDDLNGDGAPGLDDLLQVTPVDAAGRPLAGGAAAAAAHDQAPMAGFRIAAAPFGSAVGDHQFPTLRSFAVGVLHTVFGMPVADPVLGHEPAAGGGVSAAGAPQPYFPLALEAGEPARGLAPAELDLLELYLLNHPAPAVARQSAATRRGRELLKVLGCTSCHTEAWQLPADGAAADRRFFVLEAVPAGPAGELEGRLRRRAGAPRPPTRVEGFYSDLRHHDLGERFYEYSYEGGRLYVIRRFRTPPLWGVASTPPYGHDGQSPDLDDVIRRHGGEAEAAAGLYRQLSPRRRQELLLFLQTLVLFQPDAMPADVDGDGVAARSFSVAGQPVGGERFLPEFLFRAPPQYRGWVDRNGEKVFSLGWTESAAGFARDP